MVMDENCPKAKGPVGPEQLGRLFDEHVAPLEFYARQWCTTTEDVVQEAFILLAAERQAPRHVVAWLYRVVRNRAINASRSARRRKHHETAASEPQGAWFIPSPGDQLDARKAAEVLDALPDEQREVVVAHVWGGLTFRQIAELAGISRSTAYRRFESALEAIREKLEPSWLKNISTKA